MDEVFDAVPGSMLITRGGLVYVKDKDRWWQLVTGGMQQGYILSDGQLSTSLSQIEGWVII